MSSRAVVWLSRALWLLVGVTGWFAIGHALDGRAGVAAVVVQVATFAVFGIALVGLVVPSSVSITVARMAAPLAVVAAVVALVAGAGAARGVAFLAVAAVNTLVIGGGEVGEAFAQASAYGDEDRYPLRPPIAYLVPVVVSWTLWAAALTAGVLLLASQRWPLGVVLTGIAAAAARPLATRCHRLSRRWLVVVPAGVVIHDHLVLAETLLVQRNQLARLGLALADTQAADLTGPAAGHAIDIGVDESVKVAFAATRSDAVGRAIHARSFLVAPTRPGRALAAAKARNLPVT
ncbi:MAG: hypothetical protein JWM12_4059 [Ilumatobacteraceae bacterium]|nr:hypothetical protein [Ilumatobacteraceae bacterium]